MSPKRRKKRGSRAIKSGARSTKTRKAVRTKARTARPKKAAGKALHKVSAKKRAAVFHEINRALKKQGVVGAVAAVHLESASLEPCPPGMIRRVVCHRLPTGTIKCEELCVPV